MSNSVALTNMIKQQLRTGDVLDETILNLYKEIAREDFVPVGFKSVAYSDIQIELPQQQYMMTPLEEASILQALSLKGHETVLEIGTGSAFFTALLSRLAKKVISVDYYATFTQEARSKLANYHCNNVELITGDAHLGWLALAPYDVIVFTGALPSLTETHRLQLLPGGKLIATVGSHPIMKTQLFTLDENKTWQQRLLFETCLPLLIDKSRQATFVF